MQGPGAGAGREGWGCHAAQRHCQKSGVSPRRWPGGRGQRGRTIQGCLSYWTSELNILNLGSFWAERLESLCPSRASVSLRLKSVEGILAPGRPGQGGVAGTWTTYKDITIQCPVRIGSKWTGQGMPFQKCLWGGGGWNVQRCHAKWVLWKLCSSLEQKMEFAS